MLAAPTRSPDDRRLAPADRTAERELRGQVRDAIKELLTVQQLGTGGPVEEARVRALIRERVQAYQRRAVSTNRAALVDEVAMEEWLFNAFLRYGPISALMLEPTCEEILIDGPHKIFAIRDGVLRLVPDLWWDSDEELLAFVKRLVGPLGKRLDESHWWVDCRLPDGSRLNAIIPPASVREPYVSIRKFVMAVHSLEELVARGSLPEDAARFLDACVRARVSMLISGPTGSGKTTWLNALAASIPATERVITIEEEAPELKLDKRPSSPALVGRRENAEGAGAIPISALVRNALRMRPSRIIIGETRGEEAFDLLTALTTGHDGSLTTIHGSSPQDALDRLLLFATLTNAQLSEHAVLRMIARNVQLVLQLREREDEDGRKQRWLDQVYEVAGLETSGGAPVITGNVLWQVDEASGRLVWTGIPPRCLERMAARGIAYTLPPVLAGRNGR